MSVEACIAVLGYADPVLCLLTFVMMWHRHQVTRYKFLSVFLCVRVLSEVILLSLLHLGRGRMTAVVAYQIYFYTYWLSYALEGALGLAIIYSIYRLAMAPLQGLQRLGTLMFRWAAAIAIAVSVAMGFGPHLTGTSFLMRSVSQLQQTQSVLTLCMLLFVCLAIRPMGLSHASRVFGVSLGLGMMACADLVSSAWVSMGFKMYSSIEVASGCAICSAIIIWIGYFAVAEPKRQMIVLPTTSPFLRWNQISMALGDQPGFVAIGEVGLDMFAPAEVEVMRRAALKMGNALTS